MAPRHNPLFVACFAASALTACGPDGVEPAEAASNAADQALGPDTPDAGPARVQRSGPNPPTRRAGPVPFRRAGPNPPIRATLFPVR